MHIQAENGSRLGVLLTLKYQSRLDPGVSFTQAVGVAWHCIPLTLQQITLTHWCGLIPIMGSLKKRRKAKINKHKRRKKLRAHRHKKRTWQK